MRKNALPFMIFTFLGGYALPAFCAPEKTDGSETSKTYVPAYMQSALKLGSSYSADTKGTAFCMEGHSGQVLAAGSNCAAEATGCKSNSDCSEFGEDYVCSSVSKTCVYQECSGPTDKSCSTKYSHLRSCVWSERGVWECRITCNWQKIKEAGLACLTGSCTGGKTKVDNVGILDRMALEYAMWINASTVDWTLRDAKGNPYKETKALYLTSYKTSIASRMFTCKDGEITQCNMENFDDTPVYDNGDGTGTRYQPCIPCVLMSGGKWGTETNENIPSEASDYEAYKDMMGTHPYSLQIDRKKTDLDDSIYYTEKGATYPHGIRSARCATYEAIKETSRDAYWRLNRTVPFSESLGSGYADTGMGSVLSGAIELGPSDVCMFWGYSYGSRYNKGTYLKNCDVPFCLKSTVMHNMVFIPKQDVKKTLYSSSVPKQRVSFNFNNDPGTLLCCTLGDENIRESGSLLECIAINPRS